MTALRQPLPLKLSEWAAEHFYLSAESSYVQGKWEAYPYQIGIMDCMGHDDIREITLLKSARVGYTKMIMAAIGYYAEHKHRNQAVWQPVDDDAYEFVKTEIDPMIRDVPAIQRIFPWHNSRSKHNTLRQKTFLGSILHIRGGRSAKNYRRLSLDVAYLDELDGFDPNVEEEGTPDGLASKRLEGATFPKLICGSTPKVADTSLILNRATQSDRCFRYHIPCPHCGVFMPLEFGGKHEDFGFKWQPGQPETAAYLCADCGALFTQSDYLQVWEQGRWQDEDGVWFDQDTRFWTAQQEPIAPPVSMAFKIWTAYSPQQTWAGIVSDWLRCQGDNLTISQPCAVRRYSKRSCKRLDLPCQNSMVSGIIR